MYQLLQLPRIVRTAPLATIAEISPGACDAPCRITISCYYHARSSAPPHPNWAACYYSSIWIDHVVQYFDTKTASSVNLTKYSKPSSYAIFAMKLTACVKFPLSVSFFPGHLSHSAVPCLIMFHVLPPVPDRPSTPSAPSTRYMLLSSNGYYRWL